MAVDPETWTFPPSDSPSPPVAQTSSFGPVALNDSMIISWTPASEKPTVWLWCSPFTSDGFAAVSQRVCTGLQSPFTYTFDTVAPNAGSAGTFCHFSFLETSDGNTVVWEFDNTPRATPVVWNGGGTNSSSKAVESSVRSSSPTALSTSTGNPSSSAVLSTPGTSSLPSSSGTASIPTSTSVSSVPSTSSAVNTSSSFSSSQLSTPKSTISSPLNSSHTSPPSSPSILSTTSTPNPTPPPQNKTTTPSAHPSPGVLTGITIAGVAALLTATLLLSYLTKRFPRTRSSIAEAPGDMPPIWHRGEEGWKAGRGVAPVHELGAESVGELSGERTPELEGRRIGKGLNSPGGVLESYVVI